MPRGACALLCPGPGETTIMAKSWGFSLSLWESYGKRLQYAILYQTIRCTRILYSSAILNYNIGHYTILYTILYYVMLHFDILYYAISVLYYAMLYSTLLHSTLLNYTMLHCTTAYYTNTYPNPLEDPTKPASRRYLHERNPKPLNL